MTEFGYHLSSEEHAPTDLVDHAVLAEGNGFDFACISDHYFPWLDRQGHSPFVWAVLGAVARETQRMRLGTAVTCPIVRQHPAIVAHAAATVAAMAGGDRFFLGVGTGERLNEHVLGQPWPTASRRLEMLEEAVEVIRELWSGRLVTHAGRHFVVENAKIFDRPESPPAMLVAAAGSEAARTAARLGAGLVSLAPSEQVLEAYRAAGGPGPLVGMVHVCWAPSRQVGLDTIRHWWANTGVPGSLNAELPLPQFFEEAAEVVPDEVLADKVVHGPDADELADRLRQYEAAGFDHVLIHQIGPEQRGFVDFACRELLPRLR